MILKLREIQSKSGNTWRMCDWVTTPASKFMRLSEQSLPASPPPSEPVPALLPALWSPSSGFRCINWPVQTPALFLHNVTRSAWILFLTLAHWESSNLIQRPPPWEASLTSSPSSAMPGSLQSSQHFTQTPTWHVSPGLECVLAGLGPLPCGVLWERLVGIAALGFEWISEGGRIPLTSPESRQQTKHRTSLT